MPENMVSNKSLLDDVRTTLPGANIGLNGTFLTVRSWSNMDKLRKLLLSHDYLLTDWHHIDQAGLYAYTYLSPDDSVRPYHTTVRFVAACGCDTPFGVAYCEDGVWKVWKHREVTRTVFGADSADAEQLQQTASLVLGIPREELRLIPHPSFD